MVGALLLGLVAGFIGRALVPNDVFAGMEGPKSWLVSIVLGLVGAALGWLIFTAGLGIGDEDVFDWGGILSAVIGVVIVLLVAGWVMRRRGSSSDRRRGPTTPGGPSSIIQFSTLPSGRLTARCIHECGFTHSILVTVPCSLTGFAASNSAENAWWVQAGAATSHVASPATRVAISLRIVVLRIIIHDS